MSAAQSPEGVRNAARVGAGTQGAALVQAHDLAKTFDVSAPWLNRVLERKPRTMLHAVDGVSFSIEKGKTLAEAERGALAGQIAEESTDLISAATRNGMFILPMATLIATGRV